MTETPTIENFQANGLCVQVYESRRAMGAAAALAVAAEIRRLIAGKGRAVGIFTAAPSQDEFLHELSNIEAVEWTRVIAFHLSEYLGLDEDAPQSLRKYLLDRLVMRVPIVEFHGLRGEAANPEAVRANYASLLKSRPPDFAVLGIDATGGLAFVDSPDCDSSAVKIVELDDACRRRQIHAGTFAKPEDVPAKALSLTTPTIMNCEKLFVIAPEGRIAESHAASILRSHPNVYLFLDREAAVGTD